MVALLLLLIITDCHSALPTIHCYSHFEILALVSVVQSSTHKECFLRLSVRHSEGNACSLAFRMRVFVHDNLDFPSMHSELQRVGCVECPTLQEHYSSFVVAFRKGAVAGYEILWLKGCDLTNSSPYPINDAHSYPIIRLGIESAYNALSVAVCSDALEYFLPLDLHAHPELNFVLLLLIGKVDEFVLNFGGRSQ